MITCFWRWQDFAKQRKLQQKIDLFKAMPQWTESLKLIFRYYLLHGMYKTDKRSFSVNSVQFRSLCKDIKLAMTLQSRADVIFKTVNMHSQCDIFGELTEKPKDDAAGKAEVGSHRGVAQQSCIIWHMLRVGTVDAAWYGAGRLEAHRAGRRKEGKVWACSSRCRDFMISPRHDAVHAA